MGSKPSKARLQPTPVATETTAVSVVSKTPQVPRIPNEILDEILKHFIADSGSYDDSLQRSLRSCSLVSKSWVPPCRRYLFHTIIFTPRKVARWLKTFPVPEKSPAHYVKDLCLSFGGHYGARNEFFKHIPWFTNAEKMAVTMGVTLASFGTSLFTRLPQSLTLLSIKGTAWDEIDLVQMRDTMVHLPNLNHLILSGAVVARSEFRKLLPGLGAVLRGRLGGELRFRDSNRHFMVMLLEVPTGLHSTKIHIHADCVRHLRTVGLVEACCKTLVQFSYLCIMRLGQSHPFRSPCLTNWVLALFPERRWLGILRAALRLFRVPKAPNSDLLPSFFQRIPPLYPCGPLDPQTLHLPTPIPCPSPLHRSHLPHLRNLESGKHGQRSPTDRRRILPDRT